MGTDKDRATRTANIRKDNATRRGKVERARKGILEKGKIIDSKPIENSLAPQSLVPTEVR